MLRKGMFCVPDERKVKGVDVMKDKEIKLDEIEVSHTN